MKIIELDNISEGIFSRIGGFFGNQPVEPQPEPPKKKEPIYLDDAEIDNVVSDIVYWIHKNIDIPEKRKLLKAASEARVKPWELTIFQIWLERWSRDFESRERYRKFSKEDILRTYGRRIKKSVYDNWFATK